MSVRLETVSASDRICHNNIALCMHCMLTRIENGKVQSIVTTQLSRSVSKINDDFGRKLQIFSPH